MSILHATYLRCIKPYVNNQTVALEIGPGRGAWTKTLLPSKEIYVMDALSSSHNEFYDYVPRLEKLKYIQVKDFSCAELPNKHFNYMFSFGTFCHMSFESIELYAKNLFDKLQPGANCFWMIGNYEKWNHAAENYNLKILSKLISYKLPFRRYIVYFFRKASIFGSDDIQIRTPDQDDLPFPGRWYDTDLSKVCLLLENLGYTVIDPDVGTNLRDPIIHFKK